MSNCDGSGIPIGCHGCGYCRPDLYPDPAPPRRTTTTQGRDWWADLPTNTEGSPR